MLSSTYQSTDRPLLSTRYEPLLEHLISVLGGLSGAPPRGQPWTSAVTLSQGRNGLSVRRMAGVVDVSRALAVSPLALRITAQRVARFDPYNTRNCLLLKKLRREIQ